MKNLFLIAALLIAGNAIAETGALKPVNLRCERLANPLGVDVPQPLGPEGITLTVHAKRVRLEQDNWRYTVMNRKNIVPRPSAQTSAHRNFVPTDVLAARLRAGDAVVADLVTEPGEPTPPVIEDIDATSDAPLKLNVGLGNDEIGYILRDGEFSRDVYDYERTLSLGQHTAGTLTDAIRELRKGL